MQMRFIAVFLMHDYNQSQEGEVDLVYFCWCGHAENSILKYV